MKKIRLTFIMLTIIILVIVSFSEFGISYSISLEKDDTSFLENGCKTIYSGGMNTIISSFRKLWFITENGELYSRQSDWDYQTLTESNVVLKKIIDEGSDIYALSNSDSYSRPIYAIKTDGTVWQLVEESDTYSLEKVKGIENCIKISNGDKHVMALTTDGSVYTWGDNTYGQLGDGTNESRDTPKKIEALSDIIDISSSSHVCMALSGSGKVYTWGDNIEGQIGNGSYAESEEERSHNTVYHVDTISNITQIASGSSLCVALRNDGTVYHWGSRNTAHFFCIPSPTVVEGLDNIVQISAQNLHGLALSSSGEIWRWGWVIDAPGEGMDLPRKMAEFPNAIAIAAGYNDIVVTNNGEIWQGFSAKHDDPDAGTAFCHSGIFERIFTKEDVQKYGIRLKRETIESPSEWAVEYVDTAIKAGLLPQPFQNNYSIRITRLEFCRLVDNFLYVNMGWFSKDNNLQHPFTDVEDTSITTLWENGIISGKSETQFCPYDFITREELAAILKRVYDFMEHGNNSTSNSILFGDQDKISSWAIDSVNFASSHGILIGDADYNFRPKEYLTKQEAIIALVRLSNL